VCMCIYACVRVCVRLNVRTLKCYIATDNIKPEAAIEIKRHPITQCSSVGGSRADANTPFNLYRSANSSYHYVKPILL
jgi:hypothetical protein